METRREGVMRAGVTARMGKVGGRFRIFRAEARGILARTSGFIAEAGFSHSLTPARNCTYGCTYCYVPTLRIYGGLKREDWERWGQFTTYKQNAAALLRGALRPGMRIYCSPLVDPYQPAEETQRAMPEILAALLAHPPAVVGIQTRSPLILRDVGLLVRLAGKTRLRVSFSVTTDREEIRRLYEPHCAGIEERLAAIGALEAAGIRTHATLAPLLPCDAERLLAMAMAASGRDVIADPLHVRAVKRFGATTHEAAWRIASKHGHEEWFEANFQTRLIATMKEWARAAGRRLETGPEAFRWLAQT